MSAKDLLTEKPKDCTLTDVDFELVKDWYNFIVNLRDNSRQFWEAVTEFYWYFSSLSYESMLQWLLNMRGDKILDNLNREIEQMARKLHEKWPFYFDCKNIRSLDPNKEDVIH